MADPATATAAPERSIADFLIPGWVVQTPEFITTTTQFRERLKRTDLFTDDELKVQWNSILSQARAKQEATRNEALLHEGLARSAPGSLAAFQKLVTGTVGYLDESSLASRYPWHLPRKAMNDAMDQQWPNEDTHTKLRGLFTELLKGKKLATTEAMVCSLLLDLQFDDARARQFVLSLLLRKPDPTERVRYFNAHQAIRCGASFALEYGEAASKLQLPIMPPFSQLSGLNGEILASVNASPTGGSEGPKRFFRAPAAIEGGTDHWVPVQQAPSGELVANIGVAKDFANHADNRMAALERRVGSLERRGGGGRGGDRGGGRGGDRGGHRGNGGGRTNYRPRGAGEGEDVS